MMSGLRGISAECNFLFMDAPISMFELKTDLQVKAAKYMVTACCSCQRIKTDDGHWSNGDELLALVLPKGLVTHSLCPDCVKVHYPELCPLLKQVS